MLSFDIPTAITVTGFVVMIVLAAVTLYFSYVWHRALRHVTTQGLLELQRGTRELRREVDENLQRLDKKHDEMRKLQITIGGLVYREDEKTRALITARFDEVLRRLPSS
jgi:uncharacterized membrane protein (DUF106 family)